MRKFLFLIAILASLIGCKGPKGDPGTPGANGHITEFTGLIPSVGDVNIGTIPSNAGVLVYYHPAGVVLWEELGYSANVSSPWAAVNYSNGYVHYYNCSTTDSYKIIVVSPD